MVNINTIGADASGAAHHEDLVHHNDGPKAYVSSETDSQLLRDLMYANGVWTNARMAPLAHTHMQVHVQLSLGLVF